MDLPTPLVDALNDPRDYRPNPDSVIAVNVALLLGQPLLLTGEPGVGKTQLAYNVARELGLGEPLKVEVKSTTEARDLFYTFDAVTQFRDAHSGRAADVSTYLTFQALGKAFLLTLEPESELVRRYWDPQRNGPFTGPRRSVVLIDEVDKAPRDVPNDILNELELGHFLIAEDQNTKVPADRAFQPVLILTSNSEKLLPDPFLRRCIYHNIAFPDPEELRRIVAGRIARLRSIDGRDAPTIDLAVQEELLQLFLMFRQPGRALRRPPSVAELLAAFTLLERAEARVRSLKGGDPPWVIDQVLTTLIKDKDDLAAAGQIVQEWRNAEALATP